MPLVNIEARRAYRRAYYLARSKARRSRLQAEAKERKAAEALLPKPMVSKICVGCGVDITRTYKIKRGPKCAACNAAYMKGYRQVNAKRIAESKRAWVERNADYKAAQDKQYALDNPEKRRLARAKWEAKNPGATNAAKAANRVARKERIPTWLSEDDKWLIAELYDLATLRTALFGFVWHVDHVIPLKGKKVSGLHVPWNLQVIPWVDNLRKGVSFVQ